MYAKGRYDAIEVKYCNHNDIDEEVNRLLENIELAHRMNSLPDVDRYILITDISTSPETANRLDKICKKHNIRLDLVDHHQVKDELKEYEWVHVNSNPDVCGTSLLRDYLSCKPAIYNPDNWDVLDYQSTLSFVNDVCLYDTWRFDKTKETNSENLNILLDLMGEVEFEMLISSRLMSQPEKPYIVSDEPEYVFVEAERKKKKKYCALRNQNIQITDYKGYKIGVVFAERYISSVGDYILTRHPEIDFCVIVNLPSSVSVRTQKDCINLAQDIAMPLGGGGHPKAAGYRINKVDDKVIKELISFND